MLRSLRPHDAPGPGGVGYTNRGSSPRIQTENSYALVRWAMYFTEDTNVQSSLLRQFDELTNYMTHSLTHSPTAPPTRSRTHARTHPHTPAHPQTLDPCHLALPSLHTSLTHSLLH
jgi:hypothetical protein